MKKLVAFVLISSLAVSCRYDDSTPDRPCYRCRIAETLQGVTASSFYDECDQANVARFIQANTYQYTIVQHGLSYQLYRVTTCQPK